MGGIGSPKMIYESCITDFDNLKTINENDPIFSNLELLQHGIIIIANKGQRLAGVIFDKNELENILLIGFRIQTRHRSWGSWRTKIVHIGKLEIKLIDSEIFHFIIPVPYFTSIQKFFQKDFFLNRFSFAISTDPIKIDNGSWVFEPFRFFQ